MNKSISKFIAIALLLSTVLSGCSVTKKEKPVGEYHLLQINMLHVDGGGYLAANTNSMTLGDELERQNEMGDESEPLRVKLKKGKGGRVIHEFDGFKNNEKHKWSIYSDSCEDGVCSDDVDSIELNEELDFTIVYEDR